MAVDGRGGRAAACDRYGPGLRHIHERGVWHCDIKPSNLLWTDDGVKLIDFGIAKTADSSEGHTYTSPRYTPPDSTRFPQTAPDTPTVTCSAWVSPCTRR